MILKELEPLRSTDPLLRAGHAAEEQLAHYLRRAFGTDPDVRVFNYLRLVRDGDAAQIDHLILHRWGVLLIESKSVTSRVVINAHGEWTRHFERKVTGMPSPILQAKRQGEFLRSYLYAQQETLLAKFLLGKLQKTFTYMAVDVLVAISDGGVIERPPELSLPEVCKADQTPDKVRAILKRLARENSPLNLNPAAACYSLTAEERVRISDFLLEHHRPLGAVARSEAAPTPPVDLPAAPEPAICVPPGAVEPAASPPAGSAPAADGEPRCRGCGSGRLSILWGKFGYYFKCGDCDANTPIKEECSRCGARKKLRKSGRQFFSECVGCVSPELFFLNSEGVIAAPASEK